MARLKSILRGTNGEVFEQLLTYYRPPPAEILDVTCGQKHFWDTLKGSIGNTTLFGGEAYKVTFTDIRPIGDHQLDYRFILVKHPEWAGKFHVVVYDPPYTQLTLQVDGIAKWDIEKRYAVDKFNGSTGLSSEHFRRFIKQAYQLTRTDGIVIVKLQDTVNYWHFRFWDNLSPFTLEALYIHDLGQNWAENVEVKNARKPIPMHAYWFILVK